MVFFQSKNRTTVEDQGDQGLPVLQTTQSGNCLKTEFAPSRFTEMILIEIFFDYINRNVQFNNLAWCVHNLPDNTKSVSLSLANNDLKK